MLKLNDRCGASVAQTSAHGHLVVLERVFVAHKNFKISVMISESFFVDGKSRSDFRSRNRITHYSVPRNSKLKCVDFV
jgi:hypothetical protein